MSKTSPTPWHLDADELHAFVIDAEGSQIAMVQTSPHANEEVHHTDARSLADAHLMAAAPDLLRACKLANDYLDQAAVSGVAGELLKLVLKNAIGNAQ